MLTTGILDPEQRVEQVQPQGRAGDLQAARDGSVSGSSAAAGLGEGLWLCPIEDRRRLDSPREGMLEGFSLGNYLLLVDYTGRLFREGKAVISAESARSRAAGQQRGELAGAVAKAGRRVFAGSVLRDHAVPVAGSGQSSARIAWRTWPGARHVEAGRNRKADSRLEMPRVTHPSRSRCRHFGRVSSGKPPNPLDFHTSTASNRLSFSSQLPEMAD